MIPFAEYIPDQPALENKGSTEAKNVVPALTGYRCLKDLQPFSGASTDKLLSIFAGKDDDGLASIYAGDAGKLYKFKSLDSSLEDKSKSGGYSTTINNYWDFVQFGEQLLATNFNDPIQTNTVSQATLFSDLSGSPPRSKFLEVVRDQVFCGYTNDPADGTKPYRLRWSGINDATSWTSGTNLSDFQDIVDVGDCTGLVGGEFLIALFERAIVRGLFVGAPLVY